MAPTRVRSSRFSLFIKFPRSRRVRAILAVSALCAGLAAAAKSAEVLPVVSLERRSAELLEGGSSVPGFTVCRTGATHGSLAVCYAVQGGAKPGRDYRRLTGTVTIPSGAHEAAIELEPFDDAEVEGPETVTLTLVSNTLPFKLVVMPDTQYYIGAENGGTPLMFDRQTQWIADHRWDLNIAFALHEGDITEDNTAAEWSLARASISRLDGVVPYALALGNHDGLNAAVAQTALFNQSFPSTNCQALASLGGVFQPGRLDNAWHSFAAGGIDWMVLSLEYGPRDEVLSWANLVVSGHPQMRVIVLTHAYLYFDNTLHGSFPSQRWLPTSDGRPNNGVDVWSKFVRLHPNISFVFCGHVKGVGSLVSTGACGNRVFQILANYQGELYGGSGWMRVLEFFPDQDSVKVTTCSPYLKLSRAGLGHEFGYDHLGVFSPTNLAHIVDPERASATVTILDDDTDTTAPSVAAVSASASPRELLVRFSEPVDRVSAESVANYGLSGGISLENAVLDADQTGVTLTTASPLACGACYLLTAHRIADLASPPNRVVDGSRAAFYRAPVLLADSFDGEDLRLWTVVDEGAIQGPSMWSVAEGKLRQLSKLHGPSPSALSNRFGTFVFWNSPAAFAWRHYGFTATFRSLDDHGVGLLLRYQDRKNYYKVELDRTWSFRQLSRTVGGVETVLAREWGGYPIDQDVVLQALAETNRFTVKLDGSVLFGGPVTDGCLLAGTVGLYCWGSEGVTFDDVRVLPLDPPPCPALILPALDATGHCRFTIIGPPASPCRLESAANFSSWTTVTNFPLFSGLQDCALPLSPAPTGARFFRVRLP